MRLKFPDGFVIQINNPLWIKGDVKSVSDNGGDLYPAGYFKDPECRERFGLVEIVEESQPDTRYFSSSEDPASPGKWIATPHADMKSRLRNHAALRRWDKEIGGYDFVGIAVPTDETAQRKISELRRRAAVGEIPLPFNFKTPGGWYPMDLDTIVALDQAVATHIQACYAVEFEITALIESETITTYEQIDAAFAA